MNIQAINDLPKIPMLRTPVFRDITIAGHTVRIHKPKARQAAIVATRLAESFGENLLAVFASPPADMKAIMANDELKDWEKGLLMFKTLLAAGFMGSVAERLRDLGQTQGPDHVAWYLENLLVGNVELEGHVFGSLEEFDAAGFSLKEVHDAFWIAVELCIYPTSDDPGTDAGKSGKESETQAAPSVSERTAPPESRPGVATEKAGQSVPMSGSSG